MRTRNIPLTNKVITSSCEKNIIKIPHIRAAFAVSPVTSASPSDNVRIRQKARKYVISKHVPEILVPPYLALGNLSKTVEDGDVGKQ